MLGTVAAYVAAVGYAWDNPLDGLSGLSSVPARQLLFICVGMPVVAAVVGLAAGRARAVRHIQAAAGVRGTRPARSVPAY